MVLFLFILGMIYTQMRQASNWAWLARSAQAQDSAPAASRSAAEEPARGAADKTGPVAGQTAPPAASWETIRKGPTDKEERDQRPVKDSLEVVTDKTAIQDADMPAYWNMMRWTLAQSSRELVERAKLNVTMGDLWAAPRDHRGEIVRIALHIRQIKKFDAVGENSAGLKTGYELWGWSDESMSLPFVVVVPELPPGMEAGASVVEEGVFAGYFLKWLWYQPGVGKARSAPMLIGRVTSQPKKVMQTASLTSDPLFGWAIGGVAILVFGILLWARLSPRRIKPVMTIPRDEETALAFLQGALGPEEKTAASEKPLETAAGPGQ